MEALPRKKAAEIIIETRWEIYENSRVIIRATEPESGKIAQIIFLPEDGASKEQVDKMLSDAEASLERMNFLKKFSNFD